MTKSLLMPKMSVEHGEPISRTLSTYITYEKGSELNVTVHSLNNRQITVRVLHVYHPFTLSCVMKVEILKGLQQSDNIPQRVVLKLFDRRFATELRNEHRVGAWTTRHEDAYTEFVDRGRAATFVDNLQNNDDFEVPDDGWTVAENETYLQDWSCDLFSAELQVYERLRHLQGRQIPQVFSTVSLPLCQRTSASQDGSASLLQVYGILMELIPGPTLAQMPDFAPPRHWQSIVDESIKIVHLFSDNNVLNEHVGTSNVIASQVDPSRDEYRVVMVGFAQCKLRQIDQSDADWGRMKAQYDEEGAIGLVMSKKLEKLGFNLTYHPSNRFTRYA